MSCSAVWLFWGGGQRRNNLVTQLSLLSGNCIPRSLEDRLWCGLERGIEDTPPCRPRGTVNTPPPQAKLTECWVIAVSCFDQESKNSLVGQIQAMWLFLWQLQYFFYIRKFCIKMWSSGFSDTSGPPFSLGPLHWPWCMHTPRQDTPACSPIYLAPPLGCLPPSSSLISSPVWPCRQLHLCALDGMLGRISVHGFRRLGWKQESLLWTGFCWGSHSRHEIKYRVGMSTAPGKQWGSDSQQWSVGGCSEA